MEAVTSAGFQTRHSGPAASIFFDFAGCTGRNCIVTCGKKRWCGPASGSGRLTELFAIAGRVARRSETV